MLLSNKLHEDASKREERLNELRLRYNKAD